MRGQKEQEIGVRYSSGREGMDWKKQYIFAAFPLLEEGELKEMGKWD